MRLLLIVVTVIILLFIPAHGEAAVVIHEPGTHPGNRHNAMRAAELLNNHVIEPGQVFSYNDAVGRRTTERGFISGYAVSGGRSLYTVGGGVCRTSTAVYQAVLEAGLPVIERYPHSFRVAYAALGTDASVWWPSADLKFLNNTSVPLIIKTKASLERVEIMITPQVQIYCQGQPVGYGWLHSGITMVHLRTVAESLGAVVEWKEDGAYINGRPVSMEVCTVSNGVLAAPLREVADALGLTVRWEYGRVNVGGDQPCFSMQTNIELDQATWVSEAETDQEFQ